MTPIRLDRHVEYRVVEGPNLIKNLLISRRQQQSVSFGEGLVLIPPSSSSFFVSSKEASRVRGIERDAIYRHVIGWCLAVMDTWRMSKPEVPVMKNKLLRRTEHWMRQQDEAVMD
ncbi:hypothetical protein KOW79_020923 [Hemibagrus wyckioides]|uniref:Uncharacterized protein n=1 Tax=Hemibagrus wyckioides TaxID=337641 RepID=A0A9D3S9U6_9TELE|nr:hypothetical protein KOW79_020923 [Hemibagrus wyckioides]